MDKDNVKQLVIRYGVIVITALIVWCTVMYFMISHIFKNTNSFSSIKTEQNVEKIQVSIDSIRKAQDAYVSWFKRLEDNNTYLIDQVNKNNVLIEDNTRGLITLKKMYNAKINSVNSYGTSELDSIFSNKYGSHYRYKR